MSSHMKACHDIFDEQRTDMSGKHRKIEKTPKKKKPKFKGNNKKSFIWQYFEALSNTSAKCKICEKEIARTNSGTSGMRTHMRLLHKITEPSKDAPGIKIAEPEVEESEDEKSSENELEFKSHSKKSWTWRYFQATSSTSAKCNICSKEIGRKNYGTSGMRNHMIKKHKIAQAPAESTSKPQSDDEDSQTDTKKRSWVWKHFTTKSKSSAAACNYCSKEISRTKSSTNAMQNHLGVHSIEKPTENDGIVKDEITDDQDDSTERTSWVWRHYKYISKSSASCKVCNKVLKRGDCSTSGMKRHLRIHDIRAPDMTVDETFVSESEEDPQVDLKQRSSYVWRYFQCSSNGNASCNECGKVIGRNNSSTSGMMKHLKIHGVNGVLDDRARKLPEPFKKVAQIEFKAVPRPPQFIGYSKDNCYVCNAKLGSFKSELSNVTSTTETPLHEILEHFTGTELSQTEIDESSVCQKCFTSLEKYDDLLHQSQEISNNLTALLHKTHSEEVFIKKEPVFDEEVIQESSSQSFRENHPRKSTSESSNYMEDEEQMEEDSSDYNDDEVFNSETKADEMDKIDKADKMKVDEDIKANGVAECSTCKATFKHSKNYFSHIQIHEPKDESLFCKTCKLSFKTESNFQIHIATDHDRGTGPFDCPVCQRTYPDRKTLQVHFYLHTRKRRFLCGICGSTYLTKYSLEMHQMTHDDTRPFDCSYSGCTKKFRTVTQRNIHIRVHTKEKIFECSLCPGRRFAQKWGLDLHFKKQHNNEIAQKETCQICGVKVPSKAKMKLHMQKIHEVVAGSEEDQAPMDESNF